MPVNQTYQDVNYDPFLTNFSVAHWQDTSVFKATRYFPTVNVNLASGKFLTYPAGYFNRPVNSKRAEEGVANSIGYGTKESGYTTSDDALRIFISDRKRANVSKPQNLDMEATKVVTDAILINKELEFVEDFMTAGKWATTLTGVTGTPGAGQFESWADDTSDPIGNIIAQIAPFTLGAGSRRWNKGLITLDVYARLIQHPAVLERVRYSARDGRPSEVTLDTLAALMGLDRLEIMQSMVNLAPDGVEDADGNPLVNNQFMASGKLLLNYVEDSVGLMSPVAGATFVHSNYIPLGSDGGPAIRRYRPQDGRKGEYIEAEMSVDTKIVSPDLGILFDDVLAV